LDAKLKITQQNPQAITLPYLTLLFIICCYWNRPLCG